MRVWEVVGRAIEEAGRCALVTVVAVEGSAPREAGARLVVRPDGRYAGTIGGGTLEWRAIAEATAALVRVPARLERQSIALGPDLGQCCGGRVGLLYEVFSTEARAEVRALAAQEAAGPFATQGTIEAGARVARTVLAGGAAGAPTAAIAAGTLTETFGAAARPLHLFGAGHVGRALVLALAPLPFAVTWVDARPDAFPSHLPANVMPLAAADPAAVLAGAADGGFVLAMTHSHALDLAVVAAALAAGRFPYVGVIGSATKRARFERQLRAAGIAEARIAGLVCPIGGTAVKSKLPAAIAATTVAELLAADEAHAAATIERDRAWARGAAG